jgi:hypothetical protein
MSAEQFKKIAVVNDPSEAEVLRGMLEANGISVLVTKEAASSVYGLTAGIFAEIEVFVPASKVTAAEKIAAEFLGDLQLDEEE